MIRSLPAGLFALAFFQAALAAEAPAPAAPSPAATPAQAALMAPVLNVVDPDRSVKFYADTLGMTLGMTLDAGQKREYMLRFSGDPAAPGIILMHDRSPQAPTKLDPGTAWSKLVIRVADLDAVAARFDHAGYPREALRDTGHGYKVMFATDPEGHRLELVQQAARRP